MSKKTYICKAYVGVIVEAEDEFEAEQLAGLEMDIGDIDWDAEEADPELKSQLLGMTTSLQYRTTQ